MSCFAAFLVVEAVAYAVVQGRFDLPHFSLHILGAMAWSLVVWGLLHGRRWAWLVVVTFGSVMCLLVSATLLVVMLREEPLGAVLESAQSAAGLGRLGLPLGILSVAALAGSLALLLQKEAREAFVRR